MAITDGDVRILHHLRQIAPLVAIGILRNDTVQVRFAPFVSI